MTNAELHDYQQAAFKTAIYPDAGKGTSMYPYLALFEEAGEVAGLFAKRLRDGEPEDFRDVKEIGDVVWACDAIATERGRQEDFRDKLIKELGDVLWACAAIATERGAKLRRSFYHEGGHLVERLVRHAACREVDSVVYLVEQIAEIHGGTLAEVAGLNLAKLARRQAEGAINRSGSDR